MKKCTECKKNKIRRLFYRDVQKSDGLTSCCRDCVRKQRIISYEKRRKEALLYSKRYYSKNKDKQIARQRLGRSGIINEIFCLLGNKCNICGFENKIALQIDHLKGGGYKHRRAAGGGMNYYKQIRSNIEDYQLLCANCNFVEGVRKNYRKSIWK